MSLPVRRAATGRGRPSVARASAGISASRVLAAVTLLASAAAFYGVSVSDAFALEPTDVRIEGARYAGEAQVREALALERGPANVFRVRTGELAERLRAIPAVADASVSVVLPDRLVVRLAERAPILVWQRGATRLLVDVEGVLFARQAGTETAGLPLIDDRRDPQVSRALDVGARLGAIDLAVVRRLGALTPSQVGSNAPSFAVSRTDEEGWVVDAGRGRWRAVFGFYTPTLRTPEVLPRQVQCLGELLVGREEHLRVVYLSPVGERCGTFVEATP